MMHRRLFVSLVFFVPGFAAAQGQPTEVQQDQQRIQDTKKDIQQDVKDVQADRQKMQALDAQHSQAEKDLNAKEKAAIAAVENDASLTPEQKQSRIKALRKEYTAQRKALTKQFVSDKKKLQREMKQDRRDLRKDRSERSHERHDLHRDMRGQGGPH